MNISEQKCKICKHFFVECVIVEMFFMHFHVITLQLSLLEVASKHNDIHDLSHFCVHMHLYLLLCVVFLQVL